MSIPSPITGYIPNESGVWGAPAQHVGFAPRSATFVANQYYAEGQVVVNGNNFYVCLEEGFKTAFIDVDWQILTDVTIIDPDPAPPVVITISPDGVLTDIADGVQDIPYTQIITAFGGTEPYTWTVSDGTLNTGLSLSASTTSTVTIVGTPTVAATANFSITAVDANNVSRSVSYSLVIAAAAAANPAGSDNFDDNTQDTVTFDYDGTTSEVGGRARTNEDGSQTTDATFDLAAKWQKVICYPNTHATGISDFEVIDGTYICRFRQENGSASYRSTVLSLSPLLFWPIDEESGTIAGDDSGEGINGTISGTPVLSSAVVIAGDSAEVLLANTTSTSYITASGFDAFPVGATRTFVGAFRRDSTGNRVYFSNDNMILRCLTGTTNIQFTTNNFTNTVTWTISAGVLEANHRLYLTYNDTTKVAELFINGVSQGTKTLTVGSSGGTFRALANSAAGQTWIGLAGFISIYDGALSSSQISSLDSAATGTGSGAGALKAIISDNSVTVLDQSLTSVTDGETLAIGYDAVNDIIKFLRSTDGSTFTEAATFPLTDGTKVNAVKVKLSASNSGSTSVARFAEWDDWVSYDAPSTGGTVITVPIKTVMWVQNQTIAEDAARAYQYVRTMNGWGVDEWSINTRQLAGYGGEGNWNDDTIDAGEDNRQARQGTATALQASGTVEKPIGIIVHLRPGDGKQPEMNSGAAWTTFTQKFKNMAVWAESAGFAQLMVDLEVANWDARSTVFGGSAPAGNPTAARIAAYDAGAEWMARLVEGWPDLTIYVYSATFYDGWHRWQGIWANTTTSHADADGGLGFQESLKVDFWRGAASSPGFTEVCFLDQGFYKAVQTLPSTAANWQIALNGTVYGYNPNGNGIILNSRGMAWPALKGHDWLFKNRFNDAGQGNKFSWAPFIWVGDNGGTNNLQKVFPPEHVKVQVKECANFVKTLPYANKRIAFFDYGQLSMMNTATAPFGGYINYQEVFGY